MICINFVNENCSLICPNFACDEFEEKYNNPASDIGLVRIECKECQYNDDYCTCDDCYFKYNCPDSTCEG